MQKLKTGTFMGNDARMYTKIAPKVDGRIQELKNEGMVKPNEVRAKSNEDQTLRILCFNDIENLEDDGNNKGIVNF